MDKEILYDDEAGLESIDWSSQREIVAVFADIAGFSDATTKLKAAGKTVWRDVKTRIEEIRVDVASKYDADIPMPEGDAYFFSLGLFRHEDNRVRGAQLAIEFRDRIKNDPVLNDLKSQNPELGQLTLHMAVDCEPNAEVFLTRPELGRAGYEVIGEGINRAARVMKFEGAKPWEIYTSGDFALSVGHRIKVAPVKRKEKRPGEFAVRETLKGVGTVDLWQITNIKPGVPKGRALTKTGLLGRDSELSALYQSVSDLDQGKPFVRTLKEEAGSGKTRILHELKERVLRERSDTLFIGLNFSELDREVPYSAIKERFIANQLSPEQLDALRDDIPFIQDIIDPTRPKTEYLITTERRHRALYKLLQVLGDGKPVVYVAEDLHWADKESLQFFEYASEQLEKDKSIPVGLIVTTRPDIKKDIGQRLHLSPLDKQNSRKILQARLGQLYKELEENEGGQEAIEKAIELSEGNPFVLEQRAQAYIQSRKPDAIILTPESLSQIIRSRKDRLTRKDLQIALEYISVLGSYSRDFDSTILLRSCPVGITQSTLDELEQDGWITPAGNGKYQIVHHTIQDALYKELGSRVKAVHRKIALAQEAKCFGDATKRIEELSGLKADESIARFLFAEDDVNKKREIIEEFLAKHISEATKKPITAEQLEAVVEKIFREVLSVEELAFHWEHSNNPEKPEERLAAVAYLEKSRAKFVNDPHQSARCCQRAIDILTSEIERLQDSVSQPLKSDDIRNRVERKMRIETAQAIIYNNQFGDYRKAGEIYKKLLVMAQKLGKTADSQTSELRLRYGISSMHLGDFDEAEHVFRSLEHLARATRGIDTSSDYFLIAAQANSCQNLFQQYAKGEDKNKKLLRKALKAAKSAISSVDDHKGRMQLEGKPTDPRIEAGGVFLINVNGSILSELGRYNEAIRSFEAYLQLVDGNIGQMARVNNNIGDCHLRNGDPELAEPYLLRSLELADQSKQSSTAARVYRNLCEIALKRGDKKADEYAANGLRLASLVWGEEDAESIARDIKRLYKDAKKQLPTV
ncbi:MAG: AAA family ATPase [Candidatus Aenigmarchaeota archaeon]|nr:AAA family ATPase [Candidatus Aenigmarchaeota archaeon]